MHRLWPLLIPVFALVFVGAVFPSAGPEAEADDVRADLVTAETLEAVEAGLRYLVRTQNEDGSWTSNAGKKINETYKIFPNGEDVPHVGVTSLAVLAFLAGGHVPGRGPYGEVLDRAIEFVVEQVQPSGYIAAHATRMYSHAFATLMLAEVYGLTRDPRVGQRLQTAVEFTVKCQNPTGGWRYVPFTQDSDMSVTVCQVVALRAARNAGLKVPQATIRRALHYVIHSAITGHDRLRGAFYYQPEDQQFNRDSFSLCAAGLTTLFQAGLYDDQALARYIIDHDIDKSPPPRIEDCVRYMREQYRDVRRRFRTRYFFYYGNYYAAQAMYQIGSSDPATWASWFKQVRDDFLESQQSGLAGGDGAEREGWWVSNVDETHAYATATALLILQFPLDQLPIHQR